MHPVARLEIIASSAELGKILASLDQSGVPGYTVIRNVVGKGLQGNVTDDLVMSMLDNVYVIAFFPPELTKAVVEKVRPILNKFGGVCYLSDASEIRSTRCVASI
jgi:nitrogen regulatory protein PII